MAKKLRLSRPATAYFQRLWAGLSRDDDPDREVLLAELVKHNMVILSTAQYSGREVVTFTRTGVALGGLFDAAAANKARAAAKEVAR